MSHLVCPMCSESLKEEGEHFYKHFKYKKFPCGETGCKQEFYTGAQRNIHCTEKKHKRSFQNHVNPYMDKLISIVVEDARALATKDLDAVIKARWGGDCQESSSSTITPMRTSKEAAASDSAAKKKRTSTVAPSTSTPATKKAKSVTGTPCSGTAKASFITPSADSSTRISEERAAAQATSSSSSMNLPTPAADSTTNENPFETPTLPPSKKQRKKRDSATSSTTSNAAPTATETEEETTDETTIKIPCNKCSDNIPYELKYRYAHARMHHMTTDVDPDSVDYEECVKAATDIAFPDYPNDIHHCQLCMDFKTVRPTDQFAHIEKEHKNRLPDLKCPVCDEAFAQQCRLSGHMKSKYDVLCSEHKDPKFQEHRCRRNQIIKALRSKCFPLSYNGRKKRTLKKKTTTTSTPTAPTPAQQAAAPQVSYPAGSLVSAVASDVRAREMGKTRRAPTYQRKSDDESSSGEDDDEEDTSSGGMDFSEEIQVIKQLFNKDLNAKLNSRVGTPMIQIKQEIVETAEEEEMKVETEEQRPRSEEQRRTPPTPICYAQYEPTVPPPGGPYLITSPYLIHSHPGAGGGSAQSSPPLPPSSVPSRIISPDPEAVETRERSKTPAPTRDRSRKERSRSPPRRRRSPITYDNNSRSYNNRNDDRYNHRGGGSSHRSTSNYNQQRHPRPSHNNMDSNNHGGGWRNGGGNQSENENRSRTTYPYPRPSSSNAPYRHGGNRY